MIEGFSKLFPEIQLRYGPQFDVFDSGITNEKTLEIVKDQVEEMFYLVSRQYETKVPDFEFTQGPSRGAFAAMNAGVHSVGISLPLAQGIIAYFNAAMTRQNLYTAHVETIYNSTSVENWWEAGSYSAADIPSRSELKGLVHNLSRFALLFIAGHELGHIVLGHLDKTLQNHWSGESEDKPISFDQFCREVAADRFAAHFLFNYINNIKEGQSNKFLYQLAVLSVVSIFMYEKPRDNWSLIVEKFSEGHPPNQFRALIGQTSLGLTISSQGFLDFPGALRITSSSFEIALGIHESITGKKRNREEGLQYARLLPKMGGLIERLFRRHRELYPEAGF